VTATNHANLQHIVVRPINQFDLLHKTTVKMRYLISYGQDIESEAGPMTLNKLTIHTYMWS